MTVGTLSNIVEQSLNSFSIEKIAAIKNGAVKDQILAVLKLLCEDYLGATESEIQAIIGYQESEFFRKYATYLLGLVETSPEDRHVFAEEIQKKAEDSAGNVISGMVVRLDNINKETVFAKLSVARIHGAISTEDFFRVYSLLERIPYVDLKHLPRYKEPFYDESGDTELLFATGALEIETIGSKGGSNKYKLSRLGELLLRWGFNIHLELEHGKGTNVELSQATNEDIDRMMDEKIKASRPRYKDGGLYYPDGTKSGKFEDDGQFLIDVARER